MKNMKNLLAPPLILLALAFPACESSIRPLQDLKRVELWLPDDGSAPIQLTKPTPILRDKPATTENTTTSTTSRPADVIPINITTAASSPGIAIPGPSSSQPETLAATQESPATQIAATQDSGLSTQNSLPPGQKIVKIIDPNQAAKFVYNASYDNIWQQAMLLLAQTGFTLDRHDYRLGVLTTRPLPSAQIVEPWKPQHTDPASALENTVNCQRRYVRITIAPVPGKPKFYEVAIQVLVERESNPSEALVGPLFVEGSAFGRNAIALRSDYADATSAMAPRKERIGRKDVQADKPPPTQWHLLGHDPKLEKKLLDQLFLRI
jgi:hypothetical protein